MPEVCSVGEPANGEDVEVPVTDPRDLDKERVQGQDGLKSDIYSHITQSQPEIDTCAC